MIVDKQLKFTPTYLNLYGESVWNIWRKKKEKEKKSHRIVLKKKFSNNFFYSSIFIKLGLKKKRIRPKLPYISTESNSLLLFPEPKPTIGTHHERLSRAA